MSPPGLSVTAEDKPELTTLLPVKPLKPPSPVDEALARLCCPESAASIRPANMSDVNKTIQKWHASFRKGTDFDSWGQLVEAIDEYQM